MSNLLFIEDIGSGFVAISDCDKPGRGNTAALGIGDAGALLRVLSEHRSEMRTASGDFELRRASPGEEHDFEGRICGRSFGLSISVAHVLRCALEQASLEIMGPRN